MSASHLTTCGMRKCCAAAASKQSKSLWQCANLIANRTSHGRHTTAARRTKGCRTCVALHTWRTLNLQYKCVGGDFGCNELFPHAVFVVLAHWFLFFFLDIRLFYWKRNEQLQNETIKWMSWHVASLILIELTVWQRRYFFYLMRCWVIFDWCFIFQLLIKV